MSYFSSKITDQGKMYATKLIIMFLVVLKGVKGVPVEALLVKSIAELYNETRKLLSNCTENLKSICGHHSSMECYESVTQKQNRLESISFNSCNNHVKPSKARTEILRSLNRINIKKVLNEIKKLETNSRATIESMNESFTILSSRVTNHIETLEQISSKCSHIEVQTNDTNTNLWIILIVLVLVLVALKEIQMIISSILTICCTENNIDREIWNIYRDRNADVWDLAHFNETIDSNQFSVTPTG